MIVFFVRAQAMLVPFSDNNLRAQKVAPKP